MKPLQNPNRRSLDGETYRKGFALRTGFRDRWEYFLELSTISHHGGHFDTFIETWHDVFGLPQGDRDITQRNRLAIVYGNADGEQVGIRKSETSLADLGIGAGYSVPDWPIQNDGLTIRAMVRLPAGNTGSLAGSDGLSASVWAETSGALPWSGMSRTWLYSGALGMVAAKPPEQLSGLGDPFLVFGRFGVTWRPLPRLDLSAQLDVHSSPYGASALDVLAIPRSSSASAVRCRSSRTRHWRLPLPRMTECTDRRRTSACMSRCGGSCSKPRQGSSTTAPLSSFLLGDHIVPLTAARIAASGSGSAPWDCLAGKVFHPGVNMPGVLQDNSNPPARNARSSAFRRRVQVAAQLQSDTISTCTAESRQRWPPPGTCISAPIAPIPPVCGRGSRQAIRALQETSSIAGSVLLLEPTVEGPERNHTPYPLSTNCRFTCFRRPPARQATGSYCQNDIICRAERGARPRALSDSFMRLSVASISPQRSIPPLYTQPFDGRSGLGRHRQGERSRATRKPIVEIRFPGRLQDRAAARRPGGSPSRRRPEAHAGCNRHHPSRRFHSPARPCNCHADNPPPTPRHCRACRGA